MCSADAYFEPNNIKEKTYDWCLIDPKKYQVSGTLLIFYHY
ncbi:hypothetical protein CSB68_4077 (plasmid) [Acinetobacter baumannii]|nr:hypothetical protein CSB70_4097 [Acinetobacter baumannii]AVI39408.1 hypothetical protein CSB68_4077 [Acinetobacter baumannii]